MWNSSQTPPDYSCNWSRASPACQYVTAVLGVGLFVLGMVMVIWSVTFVTGVNNSRMIIEQRVRDTLTAGLVLLAVGLSMLLLSLFLCILNKYRSMRQPSSGANVEHGQQRESQPDEPKQYTVPSYEVVGNAQYPISQLSPRQNSTTKLPAYEETTQDEVEGSTSPAHS